jgi:GntR family transcriptional regulator/MocR family aminotransferase
VPIDGEGMRVPARTARARLAYVTPAHQYPLGVTMSLNRRLQLLHWARRAGALIVEDDYDGEYRYEGRPLPALQGLDRHGVVAFTGSFSKTLFPALRLGFLVVPPSLVDRLGALLSVTGPHAPLLDQAVLCDFITNGHFYRHIRRMRQIYGRRLAALQEAVRTTLDGRLTLSPIEAGLQTIGTLGAGLSSEAVAAAAARAGIDVTPLARYAQRSIVPEGLLLGFACIDERDLARGVEGLARVCDEVARSGRRVRR